MELSTRDRVALASYTEIKEGRGTPNGGVWVRPEDHSTDVPGLFAIGEAVEAARAEVVGLLPADGTENIRALQRAVRNTMAEHCGVVRDETGLRAGLAELDALDARAADIGVHPDQAGYQDLAHAFDLKSSLLAARATLDCALERRETRGCHNRADFPRQDPDMRVNLVWSGPGRVDRDPLPEVPAEIVSLMRDVSQEGKLVE